MNVNFKYKDRVFCWIFGKGENKQYLLDLYNAMNGTDYDDVSLIEIEILEDAIYMGMKNDVSFIIGNDLSLYEHQSTYNRNMPFRSFEYCAKLYNAIVSERHYDVYSSKLLKFPAPHCYVFYNGLEKHSDRETMRLSDAFETPSEGYEWTVTMLNINYGHNKELMKKCKALKEYAIFVDKVRKNSETMDKEMAIDEAVDYIVNLKGDLAEFFDINRSEVRDMCITEYDEAQHLENVKQEGIEQGVKQGIEQGQTNVFSILDLLNNCPDKSDMQIATTLNCDVSLVSEARKRIKI